jgi:hypothetical protein
VSVDGSLLVFLLFLGWAVGIGLAVWLVVRMVRRRINRQRNARAETARKLAEEAEARRRPRSRTPVGRAGEHELSEIRRIADDLRRESARRPGPVAGLRGTERRGVRMLPDLDEIPTGAPQMLISRRKNPYSYTYEEGVNRWIAYPTYLAGVLAWSEGGTSPDQYDDMIPRPGDIFVQVVDGKSLEWRFNEVKVFFGSPRWEAAMELIGETGEVRKVDLTEPHEGGPPGRTVEW